MRVLKKAIMTAAFILLARLATAQMPRVIENPAKPLNKTAGRVLGLEEIWRVTDESGNFYFKYPGQLQIGGDGSIFLSDEGQFLRFSADGEFVKNLYKKGEGPGEISRDFIFFVVDNELVIRDFNKDKYWRTDYDGQLLGELDFRGKRYNGFIGVRKNDFVLEKTEFPPLSERTGKLIDLPMTILLLSKDGKTERTVITFHPRHFMAQSGMRVWDNSFELLSQDGKYVVGSHNLQYSIEIADIEQGKTVRSFNRKYQHVKHIEDNYEKEFNKITGAPTMEFESDIKGLKLNGDRIWVRTSTQDSGKGDLWDVFSMDGKYLDNFYLGPGRTLLKADGDVIYVTEKNADETISLVKYRILS
jgi:hypothetical protein